MSSEDSSDDAKDAAGLIEFCMIAGQSDYLGTATLDSAVELAWTGGKSDRYRQEFVELVRDLA